jgi:hypothetical protein
MKPRPLPRRAVAGLVLVLVLALAGWILRPHEPVYEGRPLSAWLDNADPDFVWIPNDLYGHIHDEFLGWLESGEPWPPATGAPHGGAPTAAPTRGNHPPIGTNAIPWLLDWMASKPHPLERLRTFIQTRFAIPVFHYSHLPPVQRRHIAAFEGFAALGPRAEAALPALNHLLHRPNPDLPLAWAIASLGPKGIDLLTRVVADEGPELRDLAALALGLEGPAAASAVPALLGAVDRGNSSYHVLGALGRIGCDPASLTPLLLRDLERQLRDNEEETVQMTILLLGLCGERARAAAPPLLHLYPRSDPWLQETIRAALKRIDPASCATLPPEQREGPAAAEPTR